MHTSEEISHPSTAITRSAVMVVVDRSRFTHRW